MFKRTGFDWIARYYDRLARLVFGEAIFKSQTAFLEQIPASSNVLVLGGGTGWWMKEFLKTRPECRILFIDLSAEMVRLAKERLGGDSRVLFKIGTQDSLEGVTTTFDAVVTFYFLDLFSNQELEGVVKKIRPSIQPGAIWLAADFMDTRWWHSTALFLMYRFFKIVAGLRNQSLPDWTGAILKLDIKEVDRKTFCGDFIRTALYRVAKFYLAVGFFLPSDNF